MVSHGYAGDAAFATRMLLRTSIVPMSKVATVITKNPDRFISSFHSNKDIIKKKLAGDGRKGHGDVSLASLFLMVMSFPPRSGINFPIDLQSLLGEETKCRLTYGYPHHVFHWLNIAGFYHMMPFGEN